MKAVIVAKVAKAVVKEAKKYSVNVSVDKGTSRMVIAIQRKK